ncbi:MAG: sigma-70 family RNA polymerase sigma factor [Gammaproteobacteria bacterium]|nr:sigma-70 family RNA polymerase sigma factor [Gammaproteobacteria bacterium]
MKVIRGRNTYTPAGRFSGWLFTIAHRVLTDRHRAAMRSSRLDTEADPDTTPSPAPGPAETAERVHEVRKLYTLIAALPIAQREALLLREESGLSLAEIATVTDTSEEGVKSRLRYAMQKLRSGMTP